MSSKVSGFDGSRSTTVGAGAVPPALPGPTGASPLDSSGGSGSIHITDMASQLAALEQATQALPAVDTARVTALRTSIEQGTYTVSPDQVADRLIQLERSLGGLG
ncbi:MAG: flagellar biosynthesis anti-sigma factor FlgM [Steroidobacteraceae bacterium]